MLPSQWTQGVIDYYYGNNLTAELGLCGWRYRSASDARTVYEAMAKSVAPALEAHFMKRLSMPRVGDRSLAVTYSANGGVIYMTVFQHENAVITLVYMGPRSYGASSFAGLASSTNSRLH